MGGLESLRSLLRQAEGFDDVLAALQRGEPAAVDGAWGSACALTAATLAAESPDPLLVVLPRVRDLPEFVDDLEGFVGQGASDSIATFPAWETLPAEHDVADSVFGERLRVLQQLDSESPPRIVVTTLVALLQPVPAGADRQAGTKRLAVGEEIDSETLLAELVANGFTRAPAVEVAGEFAMRGGILDVFPPDHLDPVRIELFGDEIESIRAFDVETQRRVDEMQEVVLTFVRPVENPKSDSEIAGTESLLDALPTGTWVALTELEETIEEGQLYLGRLDDARGLFSVPATLSRVAEFPRVTISGIAADAAETSCRLRVESIERFTGPRNRVLTEFAETLGMGERVLVACHNEGERDRLTEMLGELDVPIGDRLTLCLGRVSQGFRVKSPESRVKSRTGDEDSSGSGLSALDARLPSLVVVGDHQLFGRTEVRRAKPRRRIESRAIDSFLELNEGDLVVHLHHGIGRYRGMKLLESEGKKEEHLTVEFRDGVRVYVPSSLVHLVQKYVGASGGGPRLSKLGGKSWVKKKERASEAVTDLAGDMLRLQAARAAKVGIPCPPDTEWQREFEASFPYTETNDQLLAIEESKTDMERPRPMDRLICGDVGYGKTEVSMRAAFKAMDAGKQVAVLVPTTVLAEQHLRTFTERMAEYPFVIAGLSRFRTKKEQSLIVEGFANGTVDCVIGTHRLLQQDVRPKDLGLLVIDEEQRFGVAAKEALKRLRLEVDVLTMSATPIPRTLHMSLLGIRDISNLTTPPRDRIAIETRIVRWDEDLIRTAIVRELNRGGQVYFVHNKVYDIEQIAADIERIVPEANVDVGHGQMAEGALEDAMARFVRRETDVLVCTTIIESGLDIPNANTIVIHEADRHGLSDLHQLRGRVGRYNKRAYCYLMLQRGKTLTSIAAKRLKAIEEYSDLGAGFRIAMRDLEIRGAGSILGTEQSGHISSIGYELYCQLLENAVRRMKKEPLRDPLQVAITLPVTAFLPESYVPPGRQKIEVYRKLSLVASVEELDELEAELRDRFGPMPIETRRLVETTRVRLFARSWSIDEIRLDEGYAVFSYRDEARIRELAAARGTMENVAKRQVTRLRVVDERNAYWPLDDPDETDDALLDTLKSVLQPIA